MAKFWNHYRSGVKKLIILLDILFIFLQIMIHLRVVILFFIYYMDIRTMKLDGYNLVKQTGLPIVQLPMEMQRLVSLLCRMARCRGTSIVLTDQILGKICLLKNLFHS